MAKISIYNPFKDHSFALLMDGSGGNTIDTYNLVITSASSSFVKASDSSGFFVTITGVGFSGFKLGALVNDLDYNLLKGTIKSEYVGFNDKKILEYTNFSISSIRDFIEANDFLSENICQGNDIIKGGDYDDILKGYSGNDKLYGNNDNDKIDGGDGNDTIYGGLGDDVIETGMGKDVIYTGDGKDTISITFGNVITTIKDFKNGSDLIDLQNFGLDKYDLQGNIKSQLQIKQQGLSTLIKNTDGDLKITLSGVKANTIDWTDFV